MSRTVTCDPTCSGEIKAGTTSYSYDKNDRLLDETGPDGTTTYAYDENGNTVSESGPEGSTTYTYDYENRLIGATTPGATLAYSYDPDNIRQSQTVNGQTTDFLVDPNRDYAQVLAEIDDTGSIIDAYTYGDDLLALESSEGRFTYHYDGLGSTRALSQGGFSTDSYVYEAFGELEDSSGTTLNDYLYAGEQFDGELDQYYLRQRYYDQGTGRFGRMDEYAGRMMEPATLHKYVYVHGDPVNGVDPSGYVSIGNLMTTVAVAGTMNAALGVGFNALNPSKESIWGDLGRDFTIGAVTAPVGGVIARVLGPALRGLAAPVLRSIGRMNAVKLVGRAKWEKALIRMSRVMVTTNRGYPPVGGTLIGKALKRAFPNVQWQQHHIFIQQAWFRSTSTRRIYSDVAANRGLARIGNAGWNLMPIPARLNGWLGRSEVATQVFATMMYSAAVFGPTHLYELTSAAIGEGGE